MSRPPPLPSSRNWFDRNWNWLVPVLVVATLIFFAGFFSLIFGVMRRSEPCQLALAQARASAEVNRAMGSPITEGYFIMGNIHVSGGAGQAQFEIPISGPTGKGRIFVEATRHAGIWSFETLVVGLDGSPQRIDLRTKAPEKK